MTDDGMRPEQAQENEGGALIALLDAARTVEFYGERIAKVTTEKPELTRWTEIELYRLTDGTGRYVFRVVGRSLVYHGEAGRCGKGAPRPASELPGYGDLDAEYAAEPCPDCDPPALDDLAADTVVLMEKDWPRVEVCADAADVHRKLAEQHTTRGKSPGERPTLNHPSQRLLEAAALVDPAFGADKMVDRL